MLIAAPLHADAPGIALRSRLTGFAGFLRANGFGVGGGDSARVLETARRVGIFDGEVLRWSLKALLCGRGDEWRRFDPLFDSYFLPPNKRVFVEGATTPATLTPPDMGAPGDAKPARRPRSAHAEEGDGLARHGASPEESLASADFRDLNRADQVRGIEVLMRRFARRLKHLRLRREARFEHGRLLDLQGTIRRSVASGGTPIRLAWKDRRRIRPRLVLLLDVSRSMSQYSFFYLRLARALCAELADVHCFIFHTRITGVARGAARPGPLAIAGEVCTCSPPAGAGARASANAWRTSTGTTPRASCIRGPR